MSNELTPLISGDVRRVEIAVDDYTLVRLQGDDLELFLAGVELITDEALRYGLTVTRFRDYQRNADMIVITKGGSSCVI